MANIPAAVAHLERAFPDLSGTRISRAWHGHVGYTHDQLPHVGARGNTTTRSATAVH